MRIPSLEERARVSDEIYRHNPEWLRGGRSAFSGWWTSFSNKGRLLELGCGAGRDIPFYLELGFCVTGVDYSKTALARAKNSLGDIKEGKVVLVELELTEFSMKVEPQSYDAVCSISCTAVLHSMSLSVFLGLFTAL